MLGGGVHYPTEKTLKTVRSDYFIYFRRNIATGIYSRQWQNQQKINHQLVLTFPNSRAVMTLNNFTSKIDTIRDQIVTMQPSATVSQQIVHCRFPEEQVHSFYTIGEEELYKLVKSAKPTTCMLDPIPSKLLKELLPEVIDPLLAIINLSMSLGYVPKTFKLAVIKHLIKKNTT